MSFRKIVYADCAIPTDHLRLTNKIRPSSIDPYEHRQNTT